MLTAIVVEDQPLARAHLRDMLAQIDGVRCVGEAADGIAALDLIADVRPDVAFLDIEMPGLSGLEVLRRARPRPLAVFTTAYDKHAVTAFELQALDYVLKPFGQERLRVAIERAREVAPGIDRAELVDRVEEALSDRGILRRVFVRSRGRIVPVSLDGVEHIEAQGDYVELRTGGRSHLLRVPLREIARRLDPERFVRIHRSHIVNLDHVSAFVPTRDGRLELVLASERSVTSSRARTAALRARLRLT